MLFFKSNFLAKYQLSDAQAQQRTDTITEDDFKSSALAQAEDDVEEEMIDADDED